MVQSSYFNTSHVNVNQQHLGLYMPLRHNFNTSHVNVNLTCFSIHCIIVFNFNTSHVNVNQATLYLMHYTI